MSNPIRNIIFDLGRVILNIDYQKTAAAFRQIGLTNFDELYSQMRQSTLFDRLEVGEIGSREFEEELNRYASRSLRREEIHRAWNAMLLELPQEHLDLLEELRKQYRLFLFSNTNEIHVPAFTELIRQQRGVEDFGSYFDGVYYSHEVGKRKPNVEAFEHVLEANDLNPQETLFIDDSPQHVEGGSKAGLQAVLKEKGKGLRETVEQALRR